MRTMWMFSLGVLLLVPGCGLGMFASPKENPVIEDSISPRGAFGAERAVGTLATTAERRVVVVSLTGDNRAKFCAEPSPDIAESIASTFRALLEAEAQAPEGADVKARAEVAKVLATSVAALIRRTQGVQFYRDGVFAMCVARLNDFISPEEFQKQFWKWRDISAELIKQEISHEKWYDLELPTTQTIELTPELVEKLTQSELEPSDSENE